MFKYEIEPGFWFGAMYVSYAIAVAFVLIFGALLYGFFENMDIIIMINQSKKIIKNTKTKNS
jgi:hypothetical protein